MANKTQVSVKAVIKTNVEKPLSDAVVKTLKAAMEKAIDKSSVLESATNVKKGFLLTATLTLTKNAKFEAKLAITGVGVGMPAKAFNATSGGNATGGDDIAKDLVEGIVEEIMPKVVKTMEGMVP